MEITYWRWRGRPLLFLTRSDTKYWEYLTSQVIYADPLGEELTLCQAVATIEAFAEKHFRDKEYLLTRKQLLTLWKHWSKRTRVPIEDLLFGASRFSAQATPKERYSDMPTWLDESIVFHLNRMRRDVIAMHKRYSNVLERMWLHLLYHERRHLVQPQMFTAEDTSKQLTYNARSARYAQIPVEWDANVHASLLLAEKVGGKCLSEADKAWLRLDRLFPNGLIYLNKEELFITNRTELESIEDEPPLEFKVTHV